MNTLRLKLPINLDCRNTRYILHRVKDIEEIRPEILKRGAGLKKQYRKTITLSEVEEKIVEKYGEAINLMVNYAIVLEGWDE